MFEFDGDTLNDPTIISIIITSILCYFIYIPLTIYHGHRFYLHHRNIVFSKRYSVITIYEIILMTIKIIWVPIEHLSEYYTKANHPWHQLSLLVNISLAYLVLYCWVWRQWLTHFDIVLTATIENNQWRVYIDPEYEDQQLDATTKWYLENKRTFGNFKWTRTRIIGIASLCIVVTFTALFPVAMS